jgi:hypothetical protein
MPPQRRRLLSYLDLGGTGKQPAALRVIWSRASHRAHRGRSGVSGRHSRPPRARRPGPHASTSGLVVLPMSVITPRGPLVHCHQPQRWAGEPGSWLRLARRGGSTLRARARRRPVAATAAVELVEVEMAVERGRLIIDRDNDHRSRSTLAAPSASRCSVPGSGRAPRPGDRRQLAGPLAGRAATCSGSLLVLTTSDRA